MSSFMWDVFGGYELPEADPNPTEVAATPDSSGYSPPPNTVLCEPSSRRGNFNVSEPSSVPRPEVGPPAAVSAAPSLVPEASAMEPENAEVLPPQEISSVMNKRAVTRACSQYGIGPDMCGRVAQPGERMCTYYEREMAVLLHNIRMGLRFPLNSFFKSLFSAYELMPCQLTPNAYRCIIGFLEICRRMSIVPTVELFHLIFQTVPTNNPPGWHYFRFRMTAHTKSLRGRASSVHNWKNKFFFVTVPADWPFNREWGEPSRWASAKPDPTRTEVLKNARITFGRFEGTIDVTRPSDEMLAGITRYLESLEG
jgi:hypothetical protein